MKLLLQFAIALTLVLCVAASSKIKTSVYVSKTGEDKAPPNVELVTVIREYGEKQMESFFSRKNVPTNQSYPGKGLLLAEATFSGYIPKSIEVKVVEDDGPESKDDGICLLTVETQFTQTPIVVQCVRQERNGLKKDFVIAVSIQVVE